MCVYSKNVSVCACFSNLCPCSKNLNVNVGFFFFFFLLAVSRKCYQKRSPMNWRPLHWELKLHEKKSLQHESRENAAGNKSTDSSVCVFMYCERVCVCVTVIWRANRERASNTRSHSGSPQKSHLLTMYCCNTRICSNVKSWKQLSIWLLVILDLVFRPVELYSLA